tara:strand:- start:330 stop:1331 length:1002 start_codon:yes stop_codon:yes gene_type:complete
MTQAHSIPTQLDDATRPRVSPKPLEVSFAVGDRLASRYYLLEELGRGAMGIVYRAADLREGGFVAIKLVPKLGQSTEAARFQRGTEIMLGLDHPALCRAFACGRSTECCYAVMEDLTGPSLDMAFAPGQRLPGTRAARLVAGLCEGLEVLHARGFVHRDLKPSNLVLRGRGEAESLVLIDFDLAKPFGPNLADSGRISRSALRSAGLTAGKGLSGTPVYMSAERLQGRAATPDSDVFAAGLVLYQLLMGRLPTAGHDHASLQLLIAARARSAPAVPTSSEISPRLAQIIQRALAPKLADRYPSALALAHDLRSLEPLSQRPTRSLVALRAVSA